jgi:Putative zinc-finger
VDHDAAGHLLAPFALDACDEAETTAIEAHVHGCGSCQREVVEMRAASGWLGVFETATPPPVAAGGHLAGGSQ